MIKVVNTKELKDLIPECKSIASSFSDLKSLLTEVTQAVEKSGKWQFVNFFAGKEQLFIVREKEQQKPYLAYDMNDVLKMVKREIARGYQPNDTLDTSNPPQQVTSVGQTASESTQFPWK